VKASSRRGERVPGGGEAHEGIGSGRRLITVVLTTDSDTDEGPEGEVSGRGAVGQPAVAIWYQRREGNGHRRGAAAVFEGNTLKSEPWTWLWGETNPQRPVVD